MSILCTVPHRTIINSYRRRSSWAREPPPFGINGELVIHGMVQGPLNGHDQVFWHYPELELEKSKNDKEIRVKKLLITVQKKTVPSYRTIL
jgi:hypothetical protein